MLVFVAKVIAVIVVVTGVLVGTGKVLYNLTGDSKATGVLSQQKENEELFTDKPSKPDTKPAGASGTKPADASSTKPADTKPAATPSPPPDPGRPSGQVGMGGGSGSSAMKPHGTPSGVGDGTKTAAAAPAPTSQQSGQPASMGAGAHPSKPLPPANTPAQPPAPQPAKN